MTTQVPTTKGPRFVRRIRLIREDEVLRIPRPDARVDEEPTDTRDENSTPSTTADAT
jgi:hypothetical protein